MSDAEAQSGAFEEAIAAFLERELDLAVLFSALPALQEQRNRFLGRFGAEPLAELSGAALLDQLPLGGTDDSLCAWLRHRRDPAFDTGLFGDISAAAPEAFGLWREGTTGPWLTSGPAGAREIEEDEAIAVALLLREELVAAVAALRPLSTLRPEQLDPAAVQRAITAAAPSLAGSAWLHKYLHLHHPDRVTSAATADALDAHLRRLGLPAGRGGLFERDIRIIQRWSRLPALQRLPPRLRYRPGEPPLATRLEAALRRAGLLPERPAGPDPLAPPIDSPAAVAASVLPAPPLAPRARDVTSAEAAERIGRRLAQVAARFFGSPAAGPRPGEAPAWEAGLLLRDGGLVLVAGPLPGLPHFVRELEIGAGEGRQRVLAANLRAQRFFVPVPPSTTEYTWSAPAFEEALAAELRALAVPGLPGHRTTACRIGAGGVGHPLRGDTLGAGQPYALLVPPALSAEPLDEAVPLGGGWRLLALELARPILETQRAQLARLGLAMAPASLSVSLALSSPQGYREGRGGERYPCYLPGAEPVVRIEREGVAGEVVLFLHGPAGVTRRAIAPGERLLALTGLAVGAYFLEVVAADGALEIAHLPFAVVPDAAAPPACAAMVRIGAEEVPIAGDAAWEGDLTTLGEDPPLAVSAPPLWPIEGRWRGARLLRAGHVHAGEDGRVDLASLLTATGPERRRRRIGDLVLDLGELGRVTLRHRRPADATELGEALSALLRERGALVAQAAGQLDLLRGAWLDPVCEILGYAVRDLRPGDGPAPPPGIGAVLLDAPAHRGEGWALRPAACLLVIPPGTDLRAPGPETPRGYGARLCQHHGLRRAVLTDGLRWALLSPGLGFLPQWHLDRALKERSSDDLEGFLATFLAEAQP